MKEGRWKKKGGGKGGGGHHYFNARYIGKGYF